MSKGAPQPQYRSLLAEPEITVTAPSGDAMNKSKSKGIHPTTAFDEGPPSGTRTPMDSDDEADLVDIRRAQKLAFAQTAIMNTPNAARAVRIIYRGDYGQVAKEAKEEERPLRKYIIATDLSDESTHALEWAVGTVLRDGDTMICIYCVDEETGIAPRDGSQVPDERRAMREQGIALNMMASSKGPVTPGGSSVDLQKTNAGHSRSSESSPGPVRSKAQEERHMAVQDITERVKKFLRKTRLQVRVIVEVLHCKNPKHQILEIIDVVSPTLVILGSRGQSALKGYVIQILFLAHPAMCMVANKIPQRHSWLIFQLLGHQELSTGHGGKEAFTKTIQVQETGCDTGQQHQQPYCEKSGQREDRLEEDRAFKELVEFED